MAGFPKDGIRTLHECRDHFWFRHRNRVIEQALAQIGGSTKPRVLELGCGGFVIGSHLLACGLDVTASDRDQEFLRYLAPGTPSMVFDLTRDPVPADAAETFDVVILGDVIEHLPDPVGALVKAREFLRPGGRVVVTVPALQCLWSDYDVQSMHEKRYEKADLHREMLAAGFAVDTAAYFMCIPALPLFIQRKLALRKGAARLGKDSLKISPMLNRLFTKLMRVEHALSREVRLPFGSSLLATGIKP